MQEKNIPNSNFIVEDRVLISYTGTQSTVIIPSDVTKIGEGAFENAEISKIVFSSNVLQSIENNAFKGCHNLECVELPEGLINIGEKAFYKCSKLRCVYVPASVLVIEDDAFDLCSPDLFIIGKNDSEAEEFATEKHLGFRTDKTKALASFKSASKKIKELETKTFNICGESITCSNSLPLYIKITNHYEEIKKKMVKDIISCLPKDIMSDVEGNFQKLIDKPIDQSLKILEKEGIIIEKNHALRAVSSNYIEVCNSIGIVLKSISVIRETISQNIDDKTVDLKHEIDRKVTGLSYGIIGDRLDMLAYSVDDARERAYQRGRATAIANSELNQYKSKQWDEGNRIYKKYLKEQSATIEEHVLNYIKTLMDWVISTLSSSGLLDLEAMKSIDCEKSIKLLESANHQSKDECAILTLSIKKCPYNISAISRMFAKKYDSQGLMELVDFLDISNDVKKCIATERKKYISSCEKVISKQATLGSALDFYSGIKSELNNNERKIILEKITENNTKKVCNLLATHQLSHVKNITVFVEKEMDKIVDENQWNFIVSEGGSPVQSSKIPTDITAQRNTLVQYINSELTKLQSSHLEYEAYLNKYPILKQTQALQEQRESLFATKKEIDKKKVNAKPDALLPTSLMFVCGIFILLLGISLGIFFIIFGALFAIVGGIAAIVYATQYMKALSVVRNMETNYKKATREYNEKIDEMLAIPPYKSTGKFSDRIKIPSKIDET